MAREGSAWDGASEGATALPQIISCGAETGAGAPTWSWSVAGCSWDFISWVTWEWQNVMSHPSCLWEQQSGKLWALCLTGKGGLLEFRQHDHEGGWVVPAGRCGWAGVGIRGKSKIGMREGTKAGLSISGSKNQKRTTQSNAIRMSCFWIDHAVQWLGALLKQEGNYSLQESSELTRGWICGCLQKCWCCNVSQALAETAIAPTKGTCQGKPSDERALPFVRPLPLSQR